MYNHVSLIGRLTRDPELKHTASDTPLATFTLAVDRTFKNQNGERETDFFKCVCWGKTAEVAAKNLTKGRLILIDGRIQNRSWEDEEGEKRTMTEIVGENIVFLEKRKEG